jgi:hypothetical protein
MNKFHTWLESKDGEFERTKRFGGPQYSGVDIKLIGNELVLHGIPKFVKEKAEKYLAGLNDIGIQGKMIESEEKRSGMMQIMGKKKTYKLRFSSPADADRAFKELDKIERYGKN